MKNEFKDKSTCTDNFHADMGAKKIGSCLSIVVIALAE